LPLVEEFAKQMTDDAKKLEEDEETGAQKYRYIKTWENHFAFAFTYAWMADSHHPPYWGLFQWYKQQAAQIRAEQDA
jgi:hypothetical protein